MSVEFDQLELGQLELVSMHKGALQQEPRHLDPTEQSLSDAQTVNEEQARVPSQIG